MSAGDGIMQTVQHFYHYRAALVRVPTLKYGSVRHGQSKCRCVWCVYLVHFAFAKCWKLSQQFHANYLVVSLALVIACCGSATNTKKKNTW